MTIFEYMQMSLFKKGEDIIGFITIRDLYENIILYGLDNVMYYSKGGLNNMDPFEFVEYLRLICLSHWGNMTLAGLVTSVLSSCKKTKMNCIDQLIIMGGQDPISGITPKHISDTLFIILFRFFNLK